MCNVILKAKFISFIVYDCFFTKLLILLKMYNLVDAFKFNEALQIEKLELITY